MQGGPGCGMLALRAASRTVASVPTGHGGLAQPLEGMRQCWLVCRVLLTTGA